MVRSIVHSSFSMNIGIIGSMHFTEKMIEVRDELKELGHDAFVTSLAEAHLGKNDDEKQTLKIHQQLHQDAIREFWRLMQDADAVLVINLKRHGIENYIGGNTLMEIGFAHVLNQRVFLWNDIPDMPYCKPEIEAVRPVVIHGDLSLIQ